ncbi:Purine nucleoside permease [Mycena kentingensis (nom. inval.)]|nr:Purine nucleoside permease [Mycena kentingensis (nom. inval.)]
MYWLSALLPSLLAWNRLQPRVFIVNFYSSEANEWYNVPELDLRAQTISIPGFAPLFPDASCTRDGLVCQLTTGQGEINAASTVTALLSSPRFDLRKTYFLLSGVGGISPKLGTLGSVTFARYAAQTGLQHEFDAREMPEGFPSGYFAHGTTRPGEYPRWVDGTEVFEVSEGLRQVAAGLVADRIVSHQAS